MAASPTLVTGAAGFIGSHLAGRLLDAGRQVIGVDNFNDFYDPRIKRATAAALAKRGGRGDRGGFTMVEADIRDAQAMAQLFQEHRPQTVVHLAAMAGVRPSIERPHLYAAVNVDGTVNLLDAAGAHGCQRFIFASSSSVYGNNPKVPFSEDDPVDLPISPYAATKKAGELMCHTWWHLHRLPVCCLRFFTVYGPRQRPDLAIHKFLTLVSQGRPIPVFGDGSTSRDYTYIDDITAGIAAAIDRCTPDAGYRIYNLGGDRPVSLADLIAAIEQVTGRKAAIDRRPMQPGDVDRTWADITRSRRDLGYCPATRLEEGLARQWEWLRKQAR